MTSVDIFHGMSIVSVVMNLIVLGLTLCQSPGLDEICSSLHPQTRETKVMPLLWYGHWIIAGLLTTVSCAGIWNCWDQAEPTLKSIVFAVMPLFIAYTLMLCFQDFLDFLKEKLGV